MRKTALATVLAVLGASMVSAQTAPSVLRLTVDEAVKMALDHNIDLNVDRLDPQISDTRVAAAAGAFRPTFNTSVQRNSQVQPPASFLFPVATSSDIGTTNAGLAQRLAWVG